MADTPDTMQSAGWMRVDVTVVIDAPPARVWKALTAEAGAWWRDDFLVAGPTSRFQVEAWPGGRMFEEAPDGRGLLWFHVTLVDAPKRLDFVGDVGLDWGGPLRSQVSVRLEAVGATTRLTLTDALIGNLTNKTRDGLAAGWTQLFGTHFKRYVEAR